MYLDSFLLSAYHSRKKLCYYYIVAFTVVRFFMTIYIWKREREVLGRRYSFPWMAPLTLDLYLIMMRVKQVGIKYHFLLFDMTGSGIET